jgi:hypothetical protein
MRHESWSQWRQISGRWAGYVRTLINRRPSHPNGLVSALAEAEVQIRRQEILKQIRAQNESSSRAI